MGMLSWPDDAPAMHEIGCAICGKMQPPDKMSAGLVDHLGIQAFACDTHFDRKSTYILGWIGFTMREYPAAADYGIWRNQDGKEYDADGIH